MTTHNLRHLIFDTKNIHQNKEASTNNGVQTRCPQVEEYQTRIKYFVPSYIQIDERPKCETGNTGTAGRKHMMYVGKDFLSRRPFDLGLMPKLIFGFS